MKSIRPCSFPGPGLPAIGVGDILPPDARGTPHPPFAPYTRPMPDRRTGDPLRITFHGAAGSVTGSQHLLEIDDTRILLECGLFQGHRQDAEALNRSFEYEPGSIHTVILSHAHIDHSGNIPNLVRKGFDGLVLSTFASRDLAAIMLPDSAHIQKQDTEYLNRKRARKGLPPLEPLYDIADVTAALEHFVSIPYNRPYEVTEGVELRFLEAGHILGSAQVELVLSPSDGGRLTLLFSGDLGRFGRPILRDPDLRSRPDVLLMESTYGGRRHEAETEAEQKLGDVVRRTAARGGKVIIPAFSVGRTQEVLYHLHGLLSNAEIPDIPVVVDSPLSFDATEVYRLHPECFDADSRRALEDGETPFRFHNLRFTQSVSDSKALNAMKEPMIIISASGMCEAGRILHHLRNNVEDERNTVLIVGFMAENTLGRALAERSPEISIFGEKHIRRAEVSIINGFSAHADSEGLMRYASTVASPSTRVVLVHGERDQASALAGRMESSLGIAEVTIPDIGDVFEL